MSDERAGFRETLGRWFFGDSVERERERIKGVADLLVEAYSRGPALLTPEMMAEQLSEVDPRMLDMIVRQLTQYDTIFGTENTEEARMRAVQEARPLYIWDVVAGRLIDLWTDFGFGLKVDISPKDETAKEFWDEFWSAPRNSPVLGERDIHELSAQLLTDGEFYFALFISKTDGTSTVRVIPTDQIKQRVTLAQDATIPLYWRREWNDQQGQKTGLFYRDWRASDRDAVKARDQIKQSDGEPHFAEDENSDTDVVVIPVQHKRRNGRGWPLTTSGAPWYRTYNSFIQDRASVAKAVATFVDKLKIKGGGRAVEAIKTQLESTLAKAGASGPGVEKNPRPAAGSTWLENEAVERTRQSLVTGAQDAQADAGMMIGQAGLSGGVFPHWLGRGEAFRLATATSMEVPIMRVFQRYQNFWSSVWRDLARAVLDAGKKYGKGSWQTSEVDVNSDAIIQIDISAVDGLIAAISQSLSNGGVDIQVAQAATNQLIRLGLSSLGVADLDTLLGPPPEYSPEAETPPAQESSPEMFAEDGQGTFDSGIKKFVYGLWTEQITQFDFVDGMVGLLQRRLSQAWYEGAAKCGIKQDELTEKETTALQELINQEFLHLSDFSTYIILNNRSNDGELANVMKRAGLWMKRYADAQAKGEAMACGDRKKKWVWGEGKAHCQSCTKLNGKVKRNSYWSEKGVLPGNRPNPKLDCGGWECGCHLEDTDDPVSKGPLPSLP